MNICKLVFVVLVLVWGVQALAPASYGAGTYHGTVIDAETNAPLEGAVVVVIWYKKPLITMDGPQYFHKATEVLTDADGKFSVDASPGMNWNPFRRVLTDPEIYPYITIFMPGYGPFPVAQVSPASEAEAKQAMLGDGAVVKLPKLTRREDLVRYADIPCCGVGLDTTTLRHIPTLLRLINVQRKSVGLGGAIGPVEQGRSP